MDNILDADLLIIAKPDKNFVPDTMGPHVGAWEYIKEQNQLYFSQTFLELHATGAARSSLHYSELFVKSTDLDHQHFIDKLHHTHFTNCTVTLKSKLGMRKLLLCRLQNDNSAVISGLCILLDDPTAATQEENAATHTAAKFMTIGKMASSIAHEINNPLSIIRMNAEILSTSESLLGQPDKIRSKCQKIIATADRIASIVRALRSISASTQKPNYAWIRFRDLMDDIIEFCQHKLNDDAVDITINMHHISNEKYYLDHAQITQALINLLNNACDAIRGNEKKWIRIDAEQIDGFLHVYVTDSGASIPHDTVQKMTNELFTTKGSNGLGLGLSLVQAYLSSHGGHLGYKTSEGHTCFYIALPLHVVKPAA